MRWLAKLESYWALNETVMGLNRRNSVFVSRYNPLNLINLVNDKVNTKEVLAGVGVPLPATYFVADRLMKRESFNQACRTHDDFVLKPARSLGGKGVIVVIRRDGEHWFGWGERVYSLKNLLYHVDDVVAGAYSMDEQPDRCLMEERLILHDDMHVVSDCGIVDVRVLVFRGVPVFAMMRIPTRYSHGIANLHQGGLGMGVDLTTGRPRGWVWLNRAVTRHPDTGKPFPDFTVPFWEEILAIAARCYDAIPLGYQGVDIVIDQRRGPVVLEVNARPGLAIQVANRRGIKKTMEMLAAKNLAGLDLAGRVSLGKELALQERFE